MDKVRKRDGRIAPFDESKIINAISKAMKVTGEDNGVKAEKVAKKVVEKLQIKYRSGGVPAIEEIQDVVEEELILAEFAKTAKAYIIYRHQRAEIRAQKKEVPRRVKELAEESKKYFRNPLAEFIYFGHYSRWIPEENRRETWIETVNRYMKFMFENIGDALLPTEYEEIRLAILRQEVMPSMRLMWSAGAAARATNVTAYNCSFTAPRNLRDFGEIMYLLMCGTGVGFSVEDHIIQSLPQIKFQKNKTPLRHVITDSKEGWANGLTLGLETWFSGEDILFDYSQVRPYGSRLKTMGGRASGPDPLRAVLDFSRNTILKKQGRRLHSINVHDIICKIGQCVEMGGVRRSAELSLSDLDDDKLRLAKIGYFFNEHPQRTMANNSAVYLQKPSAEEFLEEWLSLIKSKSGERGIFNRGGLQNQLPKRRWQTFKHYAYDCGTNPCGEIILRLKQFCNVTEMVARIEDNAKSLMRKIKIATILGTYQSTLTKFPYLSAEWQKNCEEERLLGVSITGQWDCPAIHNEELLRQLKKTAIETNKIYADKFQINPSTAITCVKPSGTVSQLVDSASGLHPRYAQYYIRRVRIDASDPLFKMLKDQKVLYHPEVGQIDGLATQYVFEFPVQAPNNAVTMNDLSAIQQLEYWKSLKLNFTEHNPSVTVYVGEKEWIETANWLYNNWDVLGGMTFLPRNNHIYSLAPYEAITEEKYKELIVQFPQIDYSQILAYEKEDETKGARELACASGQCEL